MNLGQIISRHRPEGFVGRGDKYLAPIAQEVKRDLAGTMRHFSNTAFQLDSQSLNEVAAALAELGEDLHHDLGLWRSLESYHADFFGSSLPFPGAEGEPRGERPISPARIQHYLWVLWSHFKPRLVINPGHRDLVVLAKVAAARLADLFARVPRDSGIQRFWNEPNDYGWNVKVKLLWVGRHSYLFRHFFEDHMADMEKPNVSDPSDEKELELLIGRIDDFVCQTCTPWSGLGVVDVLARALDLDDEDRRALRNWHLRHVAPYEMLSRKEQDGVVATLRGRNVVSDKEYQIRMNEPNCPFLVGQTVFGSLVPWRGEWYWSGMQKTWDDPEGKVSRELADDLLRRNSQMTYRYRPDLEEKARKSMQGHHADFLETFGDDLVVFPDGETMTAALNRHFNEFNRKKAASLGCESPPPLSTQFPRALSEAKHGIGAFSHPVEGHEYHTGFDGLVSGMKKRGQGLTEDESFALLEFIKSPSSSPDFVQRLVREYGCESIGAAFLMNPFEETQLLYLLHRHKGPYFRKRYPPIAWVADPENRPPPS